TLFDLTNNRYIGNRLWWSDALAPFMTDGLRDVISERFRVVPRCHCDQTWCPGEEWTGSKLEILRDHLDIIDFDATQAAAVKEWRVQHVEHLLATLDERHRAAAKLRGECYLDYGLLAALDSAE